MEYNDDKLDITGKNASDILCVTIIITTIYITLLSIYQNENWNNIIVNSSTAAPLFTIISTFLLITKDNIMFNRAKKLKDKYRAEGKAEGIKQGRKEMRKEMKKWYKNGRKKSEFPKPA